MGKVVDFSIERIIGPNMGYTRTRQHLAWWRTCDAFFYTQASSWMDSTTLPLTLPLQSSAKCQLPFVSRMARLIALFLFCFRELNFNCPRCTSIRQRETHILSLSNIWQSKQLHQKLTPQAQLWPHTVEGEGNPQPVDLTTLMIFFDVHLFRSSQT